MRTASATNFALSILRNGSSLRRFRRDKSGKLSLDRSSDDAGPGRTCRSGSESGLWMYKHRAMQSTADSGAYSAATAYVKAIENGQTITKSELEAQTRAVAQLMATSTVPTMLRSR